MPQYMLSMSDKDSNSNSDDPFDNIQIEGNYDEPSSEEEKSKPENRRKLSDISVKTVASRISNYVSVVREKATEARQIIPGFKEAEQKDY